MSRYDAPAGPVETGCTILMFGLLRLVGGVALLSGLAIAGYAGAIALGVLP